MVDPSEGANIHFEQVLENDNIIVYEELDDGSLKVSQWYEEAPGKFTQAWAWDISPEEQIDAKVQPLDVTLGGNYLRLDH